jgi:hypothetical protein
MPTRDRFGPRGGAQWPAAWTGAAAAMGLGAALGGLPPVPLLILGSASVALGSFSGWWSLAQHRHIQTHGTVYVVREPTTVWENDDEQVDRFTATLGDHFRSVRHVPGPAALGRWLWPLAQADSWEERVNELVMAFRVIRRGDTGFQDRSVFVWARWPVAVTMMTRILAAERGTSPLAIRQRPSFGRMNQVIDIDPEQPGLTFQARPGQPRSTGVNQPRALARWLGPSAPVSALPKAEELEYQGTATVTPRRAAEPEPEETPSIAHVTILLLRFTNAAWGPLRSLGGDDPGSAGMPSLRPNVIIDDAQGLSIDGTAALTLYEWRCPPADAGANGTHIWSDFEALDRG